MSVTKSCLKFLFFLSQRAYISICCSLSSPRFSKRSNAKTKSPYTEAREFQPKASRERVTEREEQQAEREMGEGNRKAFTCYVQAREREAERHTGRERRTKEWHE